MLLKNALPCSLLHFIGSPMGECHYNKLRQDIVGIFGSGEVHDALGDCLGFAGAG
jgi:hypothetical protein